MKKRKAPMISKNFLYLKSEFNQYGKRCTRIVETHHETLIEMDPLKVIDETLQFFSYDMKGAIRGARSIVGNKKCCPLTLYPADNIIIFPHKAMDSDDTIWLNSNLVDTAHPLGEETRVEFDGGHSIILDISYRCFNPKFITAELLRRTNHKRRS